MSSDPNKKSPRTFQCRDMLWETFEQMARELECSVDYLINEAMKQYARQRSYGGRTPYPQNASREGRDRESAQPGAFGSGPPAPPVPPRSSAGGGPGTVRTTGAGLPPPPARPGGLPAPPPRGPGAAPPNPMQSTSRLGNNIPPPGRSQPPSAPRSAPPPMPPGRGASMAPMPGSPALAGPTNGSANAAIGGAALNIMYQGDKIPVQKDRFVIGRGKQSSDLTLKDPNVSRQHAMIEYQNGVYFMVDMGSTNGVEYNGQRIARKQIAEGDIFRICDHDLRFTYR